MKVDVLSLKMNQTDFTGCQLFFPCARRVISFGDLFTESKGETGMINESFNRL